MVPQKMASVRSGRKEGQNQKLVMENLKPSERKDEQKKEEAGKEGKRKKDGKRKKKSQIRGAGEVRENDNENNIKVVKVNSEKRKE